jgi:histidinol-phosphatase (PHP family)
VIVDYHMHLRDRDEEEPAGHYSADHAELYVERARELGIDEIGFSEHVYHFGPTRDFWDIPWMLERCTDDLDEYVDAVLEAKRRGLPVKLGLEVDYFPGLEERMSGLLAPYPWDYLLGSVHYVDGRAVDQPPGLAEELGPARAWERYYDWLTRLAASGLVDVLAHPDLVKIYGHRHPWDWSALLDALDGVCLEISAAGLRKPVGELYPDAALLDQAHEAGVGVTLACDAHEPQHVGRDLDRAVEHARAAGYETVTVFDRREQRQEPLGW